MDYATETLRKDVEGCRTTLYTIIVAIVAYAAVMYVISLLPVDTPFYWFHVIAWNFFACPANAMWIILNYLAYRSVIAFKGAPAGRCASCGTAIPEDRSYPLCDRCIIDGVSINYGMWKGLVPAVDAGMFLTMNKQPVKKFHPP